MSTVRTVYSRNARDPARSLEIDLALAVMCVLQRPGECITYEAIAAVTGMSHGGPYAIEQSALKKVRNRLRFGRDAAVFKELT